MSETREELVQRAWRAQQAGNVDDMVDAMEKVVKMGVQLNVQERFLLKTAYLNVVQTRRQVVLDTQETTEDTRKNIRDICHNILHLLDKFLVPNAGNAESKVDYLSMMGQYFGFLTQISTGDEKLAVEEKSANSYQDAFDTARKNMPPTDPTRLAMAFQCAMFCYEVLDDKDMACTMITTALTEIDEHDRALLEKQEFKDHTTQQIIQMFTNCLKKWKIERDQDDAKPGPSN